MEHMAGKKEDREDLVSNVENQHACPLFSRHGKKQRDRFEL